MSIVKNFDCLGVSHLRGNPTPIVSEDKVVIFSKGVMDCGLYENDIERLGEIKQKKKLRK